MQRAQRMFYKSTVFMFAKMLCSCKAFISQIYNYEEQESELQPTTPSYLSGLFTENSG